MSEFEFGAVSDFIGEHWAVFVSFMADRDTDEVQCEELADKLDKAAGRE